MDEITDSLPAPEWVSYASRLTALVGVVLLIQLVVLVSGIIVQAANHFYRFQFGLYLKVLLIRDLSLFVMLAVLAFLFHVLSPNKYVGYFVYVVFLLANDLGIDLGKAFASKMAKNEKKYPVEKSKGSARKYTEL